MFAVVTIAGKQYKVKAGETHRVDLLPAENKKLTFDDVLLVSDEKATIVGTPKIEGASVEAELTGETRGEKVGILKFHAKKHYQRKKGHKESYSLVKIISIKQ